MYPRKINTNDFSTATLDTAGRRDTMGGKAMPIYVIIGQAIY